VAKLEMKLVSPSGYECESTYEAVTPEQWGDVVRVLEGTLSSAQAAQPVGINGLTEAETSASMSVLGLSKPKVAQPAQVPDGYVLVPVEPTEAMLYEAQDQHIMPPRMKRLWRLLLAAAPSTKEQSNDA
jgi:hypothetical protein